LCKIDFNLLLHHDLIRSISRSRVRETIQPAPAAVMNEYRVSSP
jgi:hypothetical protein